jgi:hypothetical protein
MKRLFLLFAALAFAMPAAAQHEATLDSLLTVWGFPARSLALFNGSLVDASRVLREPVSDRVYHDEAGGGPDFRALRYAREGGATLQLAVCTRPQRERFGIHRTIAFCGMELLYPKTPDAELRSRYIDMLDTLRVIARGRFGACDTDYFVFDGFTVNLEQRPAPGTWAVVLERYRP